jgi:hypothetical protein
MWEMMSCRGNYYYLENYYYLVKEGEDVLEARELIRTYVWTVREPEVQQRLRGFRV